VAANANPLRPAYDIEAPTRGMLRRRAALAGGLGERLDRALALASPARAVAAKAGKALMGGAA